MRGFGTGSLNNPDDKQSGNHAYQWLVRGRHLSPDASGDLPATMVKVATLQKYGLSGTKVQAGQNAMSDRLEIAVAGSGIAGLAVASFLARQGHKVVVYDAFDAPAPVGSGLVIQPVGQAVLDRLGCLDPLAAQGARIERMFGTLAGSGKVALDVRYDAAIAGRFGLALHRGALFDALMAVAQESGVQIHPGHCVTDTQMDGPRRRLIFRNGQRSDAFDLIIDATGAGSPLSPLQSKLLPFGALWATVDMVEKEPFGRSTLIQKYERSEKMAGVLPIGRVPGQTGPKAAIFWSLPAAQIRHMHQFDFAKWRAEARALWPAFAAFADQLSGPADLTPAVYSHGTLWRSVDQAMVHIGDAAHRASPQLGQGANMALLDAMALAHAIGNYGLDGFAAPYLRARRFHLWVYQTASWLFTPLYQSHGRVPPFLRNQVMRANRIWPVPQLLARLVCGELVPPGAR